MSHSAMIERLRLADAREDGFSLMEIVVTIMIIGVVMTAAAGFFINSLRTTSGASQRQIAVSLVNKQLELAQGTPVAQLVAGRSQSAVTSIQSWSGAAALTARDDTSNAQQKNFDPAAAAGSTGTVPTVATVTQNKVAYTLRTFIDPCWLPVSTLQSSASTINLACGPTYSASTASTTVTWLYRVTVAAAWTGGPSTSCASGCTFTNSTLIDPSGDRKFNSNLTAPTISGVSPSVIGQGATRTITISGTNFVAGAIITVSCPDCTVGTTVSNSGTAIVVPITAGSTTGSYTVSVINPDGGRVTSAAGALTVTKAPSNLSISPSSVLNYSVTNATVSGQNLSTGTLSGSGGTWATGTQTSTSVAGTFTANATSPGSYPVTVTNGDQGAGTVPFAVTQSQPTISTISQGGFAAGVSSTVTITGLDYAPTGSVQVLLNGATTSAITGYVMNGTATTDSLTFVFTPTTSMPANATLSVQNADGGTSATTPVTIGRLTLVDDTSSSISYSGGWGVSSSRGFGDYQNGVSYTTQNGASASFTFTGTGIALVTETYVDEGVLSISVDGGAAVQVNTTSTTRQAQQIVFSRSSLPRGSHTITVTKTSGQFALIDAFQVTS